LTEPMSGTIVHPPTVAYFSMEVDLDPAMPTYSGGLGMLAGDSLRAAADLAMPMVGVTLLHRKGYFRQLWGANIPSVSLQVKQPSTRTRGAVSQRGHSASRLARAAHCVNPPDTDDILAPHRLTQA
jgi:hypothetical protein